MDRAFGFNLIPPTRMVRLDLDKMKAHLTALAAEKGDSSTEVDAQLALIENWRANAKENLKKRWGKTKVRPLGCRDAAVAATRCAHRS